MSRQTTSADSSTSAGSGTTSSSVGASGVAWSAPTPASFPKATPNRPDQRRHANPERSAARQPRAVAACPALWRTLASGDDGHAPSHHTPGRGWLLLSMQSSSRPSPDADCCSAREATAEPNAPGLWRHTRQSRHTGKRHIAELRGQGRQQGLRSGRLSDSNLVYECLTGGRRHWAAPDRALASG
jgi:hypothetical protein